MRLSMVFYRTNVFISLVRFGGNKGQATIAAN